MIFENIGLGIQFKDGGLIVIKRMFSPGSWENWKAWKIGGTPLQSHHCKHDFDCCGCCNSDAKQFGFLSIGTFYIVC